MHRDDLLQATAESQPIDPMLSIPLDSIILDKDFQPRGWTEEQYHLDADHLERLAVSDPESWPPLLVTPAAESGRYYLLDGWHRFCVAGERLGLSALRCRVILHGDIRDAVQANLTHGLPLSLADRKAYAVWLYGVHPEGGKPSYRAIAREAGLSHNTVQTAIEAAGQINQQATSDTGNSTPDNGLHRVSRFLSRAAREWGGMNPLWGGSAAEQRTHHLRKLLATSGKDPHTQRQLIQECREWGAALVAAAEAVELRM